MFDNNSPFHRLQLPRNDVRMVLHLRHEYFVASLHLRLAERAGHEVDGLCGTSRKHNLLRLAGIDELAHFFAGGLVQVGSLLTEIVNTTMHIGIDIQILVPHGVEHAQGLLRGGRIVEIDQRLAIYFPLQNGKIGPYFLNVVHILFFNDATKVRNIYEKTWQI